MKGVTKRAAIGIVLAALVAVCGAPPAVLTPGAVSPSPVLTPSVALPTPVSQPMTRTSAAAQVAWVSVKPGDGLNVAVDPSGKVVGRLDRSLGRFFRSADGATLFVINDKVTAYSALDGSVQRSYGAAVGGAVLDGAFSSDGRWLALLSSLGDVTLLDLRTGTMTSKKIPHALDALHPGVSCPTCDPNALMWSSLVFSPDSRRLYTMVDWGGPLRLTAFDVTNARDPLAEIATAPGRAGGEPLPSCAGPAIAARVVNEGRTLAIYCHFDAQVALFDAVSLGRSGVLRPQMRNPFWIAPIFTPDGRLLYLRQYPAFGDQVQVVDLRSQKLLGPVPTPQKTTDAPAFSWSGHVAYAGGTPSTIPVSPDGTKIYAAGPDGVTVLRVPDLKPLAKLAPGIAVDEVWISGDGRTVYASVQTKELLVIAADGTVRRIELDVGAFLSSEHG